MEEGAAFDYFFFACGSDALRHRYDDRPFIQ
jgi:hypothetical protein